MPLKERIVCVYASQLEACQQELAKYDNKGWVLKARPDGKSFGEDFMFMEHKLIENPGYLIISDPDLMHTLPTNRVPGAAKSTPEDFSANMAYALRGAKHFGITLFGFYQQYNGGAPCSGLGMETKWRKTAYHELNTEYYIRNLFVISKDAKGSWRPVNYLEDRGRSISEVANGGLVSLYTNYVLRYPQPAKQESRYRKSKEWQNEYNFLKENFPGCPLPRNKAFSPTFYGKGWVKAK